MADKGDTKTVTVSLNEEELKLLDDRINYLKKQRGAGCRVTVAEAIRHAICQTSYSRENTKKVSSKSQSKVEEETTNVE